MTDMFISQKSLLVQKCTSVNNIFSSADVDNVINMQKNEIELLLRRFTENLSFRMDIIEGNTWLCQD